MNNYEMIFKRKSFHLFRNTGTISEDELSELQLFIDTLVPLDPSVGFKAKIVRETETTCRRGGEYCVELYSEEKGNYLRNIGYLGEQIDLWLAEHNIGALWFGIGKPDAEMYQGMKFVIMIDIAKVSENSFRKDMFKAKRKPIEEIWEGDTLGIAEIVRFTPSSCNTQPWQVENHNGKLSVYRYKKPGKRGIMPVSKVSFYNRIDIGIFIYILEICLKHEGYSFESEQYYEDSDDIEKIISAEYVIKKMSGGA